MNKILWIKKEDGSVWEEFFEDTCYVSVRKIDDKEKCRKIFSYNIFRTI